MATDIVHWYVAQKYNYSSMSWSEGDYDVLTVLSQISNSLVTQTLANKVVCDNVLSLEIVNKINSFLPTKKGVIVQPDEILPTVISLDNLIEVCEKITSLPSNNDFNCYSMKYEVITVAKAFLQTIGRNIRLTRFQFVFTRDQLVPNGTIVCPIQSNVDDTQYYIVTFYGIIGYLLDDNDWMGTYLDSPTASFANNEHPDIHTHLCDDKEIKWVIGNQSDLSQGSQYINSYNDYSDSDDDYYNDYF